MSRENAETYWSQLRGRDKPKTLKQAFKLGFNLATELNNYTPPPPAPKRENRLHLLILQNYILVLRLVYGFSVPRFGVVASRILTFTVLTIYLLWASSLIFYLRGYSFVLAFLSALIFVVVPPVVYVSGWLRWRIRKQ